MNDVTKICQCFTFNMGKSYIFVDVQVTDEGGRDYEFPDCLLPYETVRDKLIGLSERLTSLDL